MLLLALQTRAYMRQMYHRLQKFLMQMNSRLLLSQVRSLPFTKDSCFEQVVVLQRMTASLVVHFMLLFLPQAINGACAIAYKVLRLCSLSCPRLCTVPTPSQSDSVSTNYECTVSNRHVQGTVQATVQGQMIRLHKRGERLRLRVEMK
jgi:hypothetical protein